MFEFLHLCQFLPISLILPTSSQDRRLRCRVPVAAAQGRAGSDEDLAKATTEINAALLNARSAWVNNSCLTSLNRKMLGTCHGRRLGQTMMIDVRMYDNVRIYIYIVLRRLKTKKLFVRNADGYCQENIPQYYLF